MLLVLISVTIAMLIILISVTVPMLIVLMAAECPNDLIARVDAAGPWRGGA